MHRSTTRALASALVAVLALGGATVAHPGPAPSVGAMSTVALAVGTAAASLPACAYKDIKTRFRGEGQWRKTLLDTRLKVGSKYAPDDLVPVSRANIAGGGKVRKVIISDLKAMAKAARDAGKAIAVQSAYRSYSTQAATFRYWVSVSGYQRALKVSARAGHSEHQLGTTLDFRSASSTKAPWAYDDWATTGPGRWMQQNAWKYGFVMSYPKGKSKVSCYSYEPWHYRYVGRARARAIHQSGLVPRQYLWRHFESVH
ncbi:MAG: M15 family metallopeptidase [Chloroflexi bacterium]|nr:M15 family metallopeptidase [Chloroflexota bacterium]